MQKYKDTVVCTAVERDKNIKSTKYKKYKKCKITNKKKSERQEAVPKGDPIGLPNSASKGNPTDLKCNYSLFKAKDVHYHTQTKCSYCYRNGFRTEPYM